MHRAQACGHVLALTTVQSAMAGPKHKANPAKPKAHPSHGGGGFGLFSGLVTVLIAVLSIVAYILLNPV